MSVSSLFKNGRKMNPIISKCGYRCDLCPAYESNLKSEADKQGMCDAWAKYFGSEIPPEAITVCNGCLEDGGDPSCTVRPCAIAKRVENCAYCKQFACDKLKPKINFVEEKLKDGVDVPKEDRERFIKPFLGKENLLKIRESLET
jgi:hypothetical protein